MLLPFDHQQMKEERAHTAHNHSGELHFAQRRAFNIREEEYLYPWSVPLQIWSESSLWMDSVCVCVWCAWACIFMYYPYTLRDTYYVWHEEPVAVQPLAVQPVAVQPVAVQPVAVQPLAVQPVAVQPVGAQPVAVQPVAVQPVAVQPVAVQPVAVQTVQVIVISISNIGFMGSSCGHLKGNFDHVINTCY